MAGLGERAVDSIYWVYGRHPGFRAAHSKGTLVRGSFEASPAAAQLTTAAHLQGRPVEVTARFSKGSGDPTWADGQRDVRGLAVKFHLGDGAATDILANTLPCFFVRRPEDFIEFSRAIRPRWRSTRKPNPLRVLWFVARHRESVRAILAMMRADSVPSFANSRYNALHAYRFAGPDGRERHVRYTWLPEAGERTIDGREAVRRPVNYLQDEIRERLAREPVRFTLRAQIAAEGDPVDDPTRPWPQGRETVELGTLTLDRTAGGERSPVVFDPTRLVDGIEPSGDPVLRFRRSAYEVSVGRRTARPPVEHERNAAGRSTAIAIVTPVRRWWARWLRVDFALIALLRRVMRQREPSRPVKRLSFISFAHWAVVDRVGERRLPHPYIVFQSNFNGAAAEYFEAFARGLTLRMRGLWGGAYGVPDPSRLLDFARYIDEHWVPAEHYYCAYPQASTKMVLSALELRQAFEEFANRAPALTPDAFEAEFRRFVAQVQRHL
jgi:catalase